MTSTFMGHQTGYDSCLSKMHWYRVLFFRGNTPQAENTTGIQIAALVNRPKLSIKLAIWYA